MFKDVKEYAPACDVCQRMGKPSHRDEFPLHPIRALQAFEKWVIDFIGLINPQLVYGREVVVSVEFLTPSLFIVQATKMTKDESIVEWVEELLELQEAGFLADFHQTVEKSRKNAWHDQQLNCKTFAQGDFVLLYDSKYKKHLRKLQMHWLAPFIVV